MYWNAWRWRCKAGKGSGFLQQDHCDERGGQFKVVVEYREEDVAHAAVAAAVQVIDAVLADEHLTCRPRSSSCVARMRTCAWSQHGAIVRAADARGVPRATQFRQSGQLGWARASDAFWLLRPIEPAPSASPSRRIRADQDAAPIGRCPCRPRSCQGRREAGRWPRGRRSGGAQPQHGNQGRGVAVNLTTREQCWLLSRPQVPKARRCCDALPWR